MGSAVDSIVDFGGDVIGGAADLVGQAVETVADNPELALLAIPFMGPGMFALDAAAMEGLGGVGAFDVASSAIPGLTFDAAAGTYGLGEAGLGGLGLGTEAGGSLFTDIINADAFDASSLLPGNNPYDPIKDFNNYTKYAKDAYKIYNMLDSDSQSQVQNTFKQQGLVDPNSTSGSIDFGSFIPAIASLGSGLGLFGSNAGGSSPFNLSNILSLAKGFGTGVGDILGGIGNIAKDPLTVSGVLGGLTYMDQKRINDLVQQGYDTNQAKQLAAQQRFTTPAGIASLPQQNITGLAPRTTADVVSKPKAAKGGSINDLYNEYSELNNRMRNYRQLAKGGLI